eukprot:Nitzschia sp. Nitz4//scaffold58_size112336//72830//74091//NITZ4_004041-RA/size112336-snap-gene-0.157-mRNA-1//1//CDS//3329555013//2144//frame0
MIGAAMSKPFEYTIVGIFLTSVVCIHQMLGPTVVIDDDIWVALRDNFFFLLLVIQAGCQPILVRLFMPTTIIRSTAVGFQEVAKFAVSLIILLSQDSISEVFSDWTFKGAVLAAGIPSCLFVIQTYCNLMANQTLPPLTFVVLNQTKTLATAAFCFLLVGQRQSWPQMLALVLLVTATLVVQHRQPRCSSNDGIKKSDTIDDKDETHNDEEEQAIMRSPPESLSSKGKWSASLLYGYNSRFFWTGVCPALLASMMSGLAGTLTQRELQLWHRNPHLFNLELAFFSICFLVLHLFVGSPDSKRIRETGVFHGWTWKTWIPVVSNGLGGIFVGMVTKNNGAVVKGFAMIFSMILSGVLQHLVLTESGEGLTLAQVSGGVLGALSLYIHVNYPPT